MKGKSVLLIIIIVIILAVGYLYFFKKTGPLNNISLPGTNNTASQSNSPIGPAGAQPGNNPRLQQAQQSVNNVIIGKNNITLNESGFNPKTITIKAGDSVSWLNNSGKQASVNSDPYPINTDYPKLNNIGILNNGQAKAITFDKPGKYGYHNQYDKTETGTVIVQ